jgi:hypothetical protein
MICHRIARPLLPVLLGVIGARAIAQPVPQIALAKANASPAEEFVQVTSLVELAPGRVLVADLKARRLVVLDVVSGAGRAAAVVGAGPREYRATERLIPRPGGGAWVVDFPNRRLLPIAPDGTPGETVANPPGSLLIRASDSLGVIYGDIMIFNNRELSDTMRLARWNVMTSRIDTLFTFDAGRSGMITHAGEKRRVWRNTTAWAPLPNGDVMLVESGTYRMRIMRDGGVIRAANLPFARTPVVDADRSEWIERQKETPPQVLGQPGAKTPQLPRSLVDGALFPATFPAFDEDADLMRAGDGNFWIERLGSPRDSVARYDVIDPAGKIVAQVRMPPRSKVVGFGRNAVYVVEKDVDDVPRVRRHPYPALR